ncbi:5-methyltetrahydropteroyltriglutamate--homocysteine methyltransferase [Gemella sp. oral taxon 928]|nr:5-methyltetrahydropteroyltriglutamate--homocysteine methyltransferase [Gemella sp. oral taxon 928]AXI26691.1 5-methyltetrahydropteroyltriglutamate--homocysteine methyltransferase [Gemella sp. ND 6198]
MKQFKPFTTTLIGSLPRSKKLLALKEQTLLTTKYNEAYKEQLEKETEQAIKMQIAAGIDVVVSGELNRDNYMSYIAEKVDGVALLTMEELRELAANVGEFDKSLEEMDAADNTMCSPVCFDKIDTDVPLNSEELERLERMTDKMFKMTIPSPYLLTRSMWMKKVSSRAYSSRKELGKDVVKLLINEVRRLVSKGVKIIQIDEPILSEVVFTRDKGEQSFY